MANAVTPDWNLRETSPGCQPANKERVSLVLSAADPPHEFLKAISRAAACLAAAPSRRNMTVLLKRKCRLCRSVASRATFLAHHGRTRFQIWVIWGEKLRHHVRILKRKSARQQAAEAEGGGSVPCHCRTVCLPSRSAPLSNPASPAPSAVLCCLLLLLFPLSLVVDTLAMSPHEARRACVVTGTKFPPRWSRSRCRIRHPPVPPRVWFVTHSASTLVFVCRNQCRPRVIRPCSY